MEGKNVFRQESLDRIESPEKMDEYIQVTSPGIWIVLGALVVLAVTFFVWSIVGNLPETLAAKGAVVSEDTVKCYVSAEQLEGDLVGCQVSLSLPDGTSSSGTVTQISEIPYSAEEISMTLENDWMVENIIRSNYAYEVVIKTEEPLRTGVLADATIVTALVKPIQYIFG